MLSRQISDIFLSLSCMNHDVLCPLYHSNTEQFCLQSSGWPTVTGKLLGSQGYNDAIPHRESIQGLATFGLQATLYQLLITPSDTDLRQVRYRVNYF